MKLPFQTNLSRHLNKLATILRLPLNRKVKRKIVRHHRSLQSSLSFLYRQSLGLMRREKEVRMMRMEIDRIRRQAESVIHNYWRQDIDYRLNEDQIDVVDSDTSDIIITQDDLEGEEQLERLDTVASDLGTCHKHPHGLVKRSSELQNDKRDDHNVDPIDLSYSSISGSRLKLRTPPKIGNDCCTSPREHQFNTIRTNISNNNVTNTPTINNLPSRRSADDHLEQFMMVDPNQNIKWKQLADKFNKELGPNVCGVCHKTLSCKSALTMHYRVHTEERPFVCKVCEKRFSTKGNLKTHLGQHADVTDQYCLNSSITVGQFKPGSNIMLPTSAISSPIAIGNHLPRLPLLHHSGFPFSLPGLAANPQLLLNMFSNQNTDFNMLEAMKASQKADINANFTGKSDENAVMYCCNFCRQNFASKGILEMHLRSHGCNKEFFGAITNGKFPINWKDRLLSCQQMKHEADADIKSDVDDNEHGNDIKNGPEKFSLTTIMGLHNHPANIFSLMNNQSLLHRPMMPPFPGLVPHLVTSTHSSMARLPMSLGGPINNFNYNYSDIESHK